MSRSLRFLILTGCLALLSFALGDGSYDFTLHGDLVRGVFRRPDLERGDCGHCHDAHASLDGVSTTPNEILLFTDNDDTLCFECHPTEGAAFVYLGQSEATANAHALSASFRWPGPDPPARPAADAGKCLNCHDPHGASDAAGVIPAMSVAREEAECLACHDANGPAHDDIDRELRRAHSHPVTSFNGRHVVTEGSDPGAFQGSRRHAECEDCHNPHSAREQQSPVAPPRAGAALRGVPFLEVTNGAAGTSPAYTWRDGSQSLLQPPREYEVCFRCHSGWSQVSGQDLGLLLNPNNPSYHPVEAAVRDTRVPPGAFVNNFTVSSVVLCSQCHRSSDPLAPAGPHGSDEPKILAGWHPPNSQSQTMPSDALCFQCHNYDVYANPESSSSVLAMSRWNPPASESGHATHVGEQRVPCSACHAVHGSTQHPSLIELGRMPGLVSYTQRPTGGLCGASCHSSEGYENINYPR